MAQLAKRERDEALRQLGDASAQLKQVLTQRAIPPVTHIDTHVQAREQQEHLVQSLKSQQEEALRQLGEKANSEVRLAQRKLGEAMSEVTKREEATKNLQDRAGQ